MSCVLMFPCSNPHNYFYDFDSSVTWSVNRYLLFLALTTFIVLFPILPHPLLPKASYVACSHPDESDSHFHFFLWICFFLYPESFVALFFFFISSLMMKFLSHQDCTVLPFLELFREAIRNLPFITLQS